MTEQEKKDLWNHIQTVTDKDKKYQMEFMFHRNWGKVVSVTSLESEMETVK